MKNLSIPTILESLIKIPSLTEDIVSCQKIINFSHDLLQKNGVQSKVLLTGNRPILVWGETNLLKTKWLINSHLDVVPGKSNQFRPDFKNGKILGRGSVDTKGSVAILLSNARLWKNIAVEKHITFMLVTDEETGGNSTKQILEKIPNLKGVIFLELTNEKIITEAKGIIQVKITSNGKACHGSRPWEGKSALENITEQITKFRKIHPTPTLETKETTFNLNSLFYCICLCFDDRFAKNVSVDS